MNYADYRVQRGALTGPGLVFFFYFFYFARAREKIIARARAAWDFRELWARQKCADFFAMIAVVSNGKKRCLGLVLYFPKDSVPLCTERFTAIHDTF